MSNTFSSWFMPSFDRTGSNPADLVVANARVFTSNPHQPRAQAVAVKDKRITFVGGNEGVADFLGPDTILIDARRKILTPGFVDNHCHALWVGALMPLMSTDLYPCESLDEVGSKVREHSEKNPDLPFVMCMGWKHDYVPDEPSPRQILDEFVNDRPAILWSYSAHSGWVNSKALEVFSKRNPARYRQLSPVLDRRGEPNGFFHTFWFIDPFDFYTFDELGSDIKEKMLEGMKKTLDDALSVGVTTVDDVMIHANFIPLLREFEERGGLNRMRARCTYYMNHNALDDEQGLIEFLREWKALGDTSNDHFVIGRSVKLGIDGVGPNHTAYMLEPYSDSTDNRGYPSWSSDDFDRVVGLIDGMGLQPCTHACGDAGVRMVIDAYEKAIEQEKEREYCLRVEHCELPTPEDRERMARLGIHASMQPCHFFGDETTEKVLGPERLNRLMPWRSLESAGVKISFGSDWCAGPMNPVYGLLVAALRMNYRGRTDWGADEKVDLESGITHWTRHSAEALVMQEDIGSLEVGKFGDMVLFNTNVLKMDSWWFLLTHKLEVGRLDDLVDLTIVDGEIAYQKEGFRI